MSPSVRAALNDARRILGKQLSREDFKQRHGMKTITADTFWKRGGYALAYLPGSYKLACDKRGNLYLIACHMAMPVTARRKDVLKTMRQAYARWL